MVGHLNKSFISHSNMIDRGLIYVAYLKNQTPQAIQYENVPMIHIGLHSGILIANPTVT